MGVRLSITQLFILGKMVYLKKLSRVEFQDTSIQLTRPCKCISPRCK